MSDDCPQQLTFWNLGSQQLRVDFDGGRLVADAGLLSLRALEKPLGFLRRPAPGPHNAVAGTADEQLARAQRPRPCRRADELRLLRRLARAQAEKILAEQGPALIEYVVARELQRLRDDGRAGS